MTALKTNQKFQGPWSRKLKPNDNYCGFACGFALEDIQKVLDEIKDFSKYNPEFADEMLQKIMHKVVDTRAELSPLKNAA